MHPTLFGFIKSYGLMLAISFLLGLALSIRRGRRYNLTPETVTDMVFGVLVSSIVGVRLFYVLTHLDRFPRWYEAFFIWDGGLTLYGGIILATATVWWMTHKRGIPFLVFADIFSPGVILGIGITRIGCFLGGCCFGQPTSCPLGVVFPLGSAPARVFGQAALHPSQLYASAGGFLFFGLLLLMERFVRFRGSTFALFLGFYGLQRFLVDFTRYYEGDQRLLLGWSNNQWISIALMVGGLWLLVLGSRGRLGGEWKAKAAMKKAVR
ncbi:hypothetical protein CSB20_08495 [bacterium DOLZORAL124_64_63]|nr:MAG: hypothetical protein CSB20_08495 [bacterium DOLZORAL124_64_63]